MSLGVNMELKSWKSMIQTTSTKTTMTYLKVTIIYAYKI